MSKALESKLAEGAFLPPAESGHPKLESHLRGLSLQQVHEIQLLLRGDSVIDWYRLALADDVDVRRLFAVNSIDVDDPDDLKRLESLRDQAAEYIREALGLRLPDEIVATSPLELPLLASGRGRFQRSACTLLKVMHIIYHLDARELRMALAVPDGELFPMVEQSVVRLFDELRQAGVPVAEFSWSRKARHSLVTKLLVKRESNAARVFDRLRFRMVVEHADDLIPTLAVMLQRFIPFNYVLAGQTVNSLVSIAGLQKRLGRARDVSAVPSDTPPALNEFSGSGYRVLNFVADLPVRVDSLLAGTDLEGRGKVVFVLAEFQIIDRARKLANEQGDSSHNEYKRRQHMRVRERLLREPKKSVSGGRPRKKPTRKPKR